MRDGFIVTGLDGRVERGVFPDDFPRPPTVHGVRPDACGINAEEDLVGFVEAKTEGDIDNAHTRMQLRTLANLRMPTNGRTCPLYVVIPRSAAYALDRVLIDVGLLGARNVHRVHVPGILLEA